ncbi:hypothetical protein CBW53_20050 [Yersinia frederiksenii]|nr:hypothetical protein CBW53_20050 [Yersinia frederiksenii]
MLNLLMKIEKRYLHILEVLNQRMKIVSLELLVRQIRVGMIFTQPFSRKFKIYYHPLNNQ